MASRYLDRPVRTFGEALKDRRNLRAWRRSLGLCPECRDMTRADQCRTHGRKAGVVLWDEFALRRMAKVMEGSDD